MSGISVYPCPLLHILTVDSSRLSLR